MIQVNDSTGFSRKIRRTTPSAHPQPTTPFKWQWKHKSNFNDYDTPTSQILERAYHDKQTTSIRLTHGLFGTQGGYTFDFTTLTQTNDTTGTQREIQRIPTVPKKVAASLETVTWLFQKTEQEWGEFDKMASKLLESNCNRNVPTLILSHGDYSKQKGGPWKVDFKNLVVFQVEDPTRQTPIKREPPSSSTVYGCPTGSLNVLNFQDEGKVETFQTLDSSKDFYRLTFYFLLFIIFCYLFLVVLFFAVYHFLLFVF